MVNSVDYTMPGRYGTVVTTLGADPRHRAGAFGAFMPGVAREYLATAAPRITSTAGNAALTVSDPATTITGRLVNGTFALTQPAAGFSTARQQRDRGSPAAPWAAPRLRQVADYGRSGHQRRGDADVPPEHRRQRRPSAAARTARR